MERLRLFIYCGIMKADTRYYTRMLFACIARSLILSPAAVLHRLSIFPSEVAVKSEIRDLADRNNPPCPAELKIALHAREARNAGVDPSRAGYT